MDYNPQDQDIVNLLTKLKHAEKQYPEHMFVARRHMFLKQMANVELGLGVDTGIKNSAEHTSVSTASSATPVTSTLLETALLIAIILETGAVAYFYRDKIADFFQTNTSDLRVQEVTPPPASTSSMEIFGVTPSSSPVITATLPSATLFVSASPTNAIISPSSTSIPGVAEEDNNAIVTGSTQPGSAQTGSTPASNSTPVPNENNADNDNNGNHYGQTPKPERTKENSGNNNPAPQEENNPLPKDSDPAPQESNDQPTKQPKPTKTK